MLTVRPIDQNSRWEPKSQVEYRCKRGEEEQGFITMGYKTAATQGWEKQYRYKVHGKKIWLTPSEAASQGLDSSSRVSRSPRTTPYGRENLTAAQWNSPLRIRKWRENWASGVNRKFEELDMEERVDHRSYQNQGKEELPGVHQGPYAANNALEINQAVHSFNESLRECRKIESALRSRLEQTAQQVKTYQARLAANQARSQSLSRSASALSRLTSEYEDTAQKAQAALDLLQAVTTSGLDTIQLLEGELAQTNILRPARRKDLLRQLHEVQEKLDHQTAYLQSLLHQTRFSGQSLVNHAKAEIAQKQQELSYLTQSLHQLQADSEHIRQQLADTLTEIPEELRSKVLPQEKQTAAHRKNNPRHQ